MNKAEHLKQILTETFQPLAIEVLDESSKHAGHHGHTGRDGTHFCVTITAAAFEGLSLIQRHRLVYDLLKVEIQGGIHALTIRAYTPKETIRH